MACTPQLWQLLKGQDSPVSSPIWRGTVTGRVHFLLGWVQMSDLVVLCDWLRTRIVVYTRWRGACAACALLLVGCRHLRACPVAPAAAAATATATTAATVRAAGPAERGFCTLPRQYGAPWIAQALCSLQAQWNSMWGPTEKSIWILFCFLCVEIELKLGIIL